MTTETSGAYAALSAIRRPGVRYILLSAVAFSVMAAIVKLLGSRVPTTQLAFLRGAIMLVLSYANVKRLGYKARGNDSKWLALRGIVGFLGVQCYFASVAMMSLAESTVVQYTHPLLVAVGAVIFLKERLRSRDVAALLCGFVGVALVTGVSFRNNHAAPERQALAYTLAIAGAIFSCFAYLIIRKLRSSEHAEVVVLHQALMIVPLSLPLVIPVWVWPSASDWGFILVMGIATQVGQTLMTHGLHLEPAGVATGLGFAQVAFAYVMGLLFFSETPSAVSILGALIIGGAVVSLASGKQSRT